MLTETAQGNPFGHLNTNVTNLEEKILTVKVTVMVMVHGNM